MERSGDDVRLTFEGSRTTISMSGFASRIASDSGEADLEMSPNGLLLSVDNGRRTELRYTDDGRLSDYITEQGRVVFRRDEHENGFTVGATDGADIDESVDVRTTSAGVVRTRRCCGRPPTRITSRRA